MMKLSDIRGKDTAELKTDLRKLHEESFKINFRASAENVTNPSRRRQVRRTIARIHTVLRERELQQKTRQG